jgi:hypothetical protein
VFDFNAHNFYTATLLCHFLGEGARYVEYYQQIIKVYYFVDVVGSSPTAFFLIIISLFEPGPHSRPRGESSSEYRGPPAPALDTITH